MTTRTLLSPDRTLPHIAPRRHQSAASLAADLLTMTIGLGSQYIIKVVGDIPTSEFVLIPSLLFLVAIRPDRLRLRGRQLGTIFLLLGLWLLGQIMTDVYRSTVFNDWIRGQANIIFFMLDLAGLIILVRGNVRRQVLLVLGLALGGILTVKLDPAFYAGNEYKFGYAYPVMYLMALTSCFFYKRRQYAIVALLFLGNIAVNAMLNFRSTTLTMLVALTLIVPIVPERIGRIRLLPRAGTLGHIFAVAGIALAAGGLTGLIMTSLAASGALGEAAQWKNSQNTMAGWGILIGGRPEILVSSRAVFDSPLLGHGSWAKDPKYSEMLADLEAQYGMHPSDEGQKFEGVIPAHSHLMSAWVDAGVFGAVFWLYVLALSLKSVVRATIRRLPVTPLYVFILTLFVWDILYSPFGSTRRLTEALYLVIISDLVDPDSVVRKTTRQALSQTQLPIRRRNMGRTFPQWNGPRRF